MISIDEINRLKEENAKLNAIIDGYQPRLQRYKEILQEIREMAEKLKSPHCTDCTQVLNKKCKCTGDCMYDYKKIILDIINKAEE